MGGGAGGGEGFDGVGRREWKDAWHSRRRQESEQKWDKDERGRWLMALEEKRSKRSDRCGQRRGGGSWGRSSGFMLGICICLELASLFLQISSQLLSLLSSQPSVNGHIGETDDAFSPFICQEALLSWNMSWYWNLNGHFLYRTTKYRIAGVSQEHSIDNSASRVSSLGLVGMKRNWSFKQTSLAGKVYEGARACGSSCALSNHKNLTRGNSTVRTLCL